MRPPDWRNPEPLPAYDLVVIGGGTAGLVSAAGAAALGARVALVERERLGGECLNTGCVPSKAMLRTSRAIGEIRRAKTLGIAVEGFGVDFTAAMRRMRARRSSLAPNDSAGRLAQLGVHLFFGEAVFTSPRQVAVEQNVLRFRRAIVATGSRPAVPAIEGLAGTPFLTNESVFDLTERPGRLLIVGAGPVGCELAQAFARLGSEVVVFDQSPHPLPNDDPDASAVVYRALADDGVRWALGVAITRVSPHANGIIVRFDRGPEGPVEDVTGDRLLVAAGRSPNVASLSVERAGIRTNADGLVVNDRLRTSNRRVYAAGDVCSRFRFTHAADAMARIAVQNALFFGRRTVSALTIPRCTYTDPEVASVGSDGLRSGGATAAAQTISIAWPEVDRAVLDDETDGFVKVHHVHGRIVGCTIVGAHAGEAIGQVADAIARRATLSDFSAIVFPYPTRSEALRKAGDAYRRTGLSPGVRRALERYFRLRPW